jgi:serine/threonine-protein kinase
VRLVVLPADATVAIDGARAEVHDGVVDVAGTLGSVHHVTLVKDKGAAQGDVSITEAGAMPPKLEIVGAKPGVPGTGHGKKMRFGFDE